MDHPRRLLVLALDAASPQLLRRWAADGSLPHIARLFERGRQASTRSVEGVYVGATWPSFYMGLGPGRHGLYWLDRVLLGTYRMQRAGAEEMRRYPALWDVLSEAGRRCVVVDVPLSALSPALTGLQILEWGVHDEVFGFRSRPAGLAAEVLAAHGPHPAPSHCDAVRNPGELQTFADQLVAGADARAGLLLDLLEREPDWTFAIQAFSETHCAGHQLWHTHDPAHPGHDPAHPDLVRSVYQAVDAAVGRIVEGVGPHTTVALVDLHGMGSSGGHSLLLEPVLKRLGIQVAEGAGQGVGVPSEPRPGQAPAAPAAPATPPAPAAQPLSLRGLARTMYHRLLPRGARERVYAWRQRRNQERGLGSPLDLDPARTRAFYIGLGTGPPFSAIRLNLKGREPAGVLEPGTEADAFVARLRAELEALVDPRTGRGAVARVARSRDLFEGPRVDELPDLLVEWVVDPPRGTTAVGAGKGSEWTLESPSVGRISAVNRYCRTGEHRPDGLVVVAGPGIETGVVDRTLSILELAPTFAALLGQASPTMESPPAPEFLPPTPREPPAPAS